MKSISSQKNLQSKVVLVRVDFNVPLKGEEVVDDTRLEASLPTIQHLVKQKAKVVLLSHLGRPGGQTVRSLKLDPIAKRLSTLLKKKVEKVTLKQAKKAINTMRDGQVLLLENVRFEKGEQENARSLAKDFAELGDMFVLDGFAVAHRKSASVSGVTKFLPSFAGLLLEKEIQGLDKLKKAKSPFVAIIGGAKIQTKLPVIKAMKRKADAVLLGGGLINTWLYAKGYKIGASLVEKKLKEDALKQCAGKKVIKPIDVVVGNLKGTSFRVVEIGKQKKLCEPNEMILDIGPQTIQLFAQHIKKAKTIVWNGATGMFEVEPYNLGTMAVAHAVAERAKIKSVYAVVGGGETVQVMDMYVKNNSVDLISTGGGAMLEYLAGNKLPGIAALK